MEVGGPGIIVEIDETHMTSIKHHTGRNLRRKQFWVFGGIERVSGKKFAVSLGFNGKRDRNTLEPLIIKHIKKGSIIVSDCWRAYDNIVNLVDANGQSMNYTHHRINHQLYFVDPINPIIHTQTVERFWGDLKDVVKRRGIKNMERHIYRFLFLAKYPEKTLHHLMIEAGKSYPYPHISNV